MALSQVIVVGGGLSGLSAAHTVLEHGARVVVIDKNPFFGGNSTKATSGINGALTKTQISLGIKDSVESFEKDTAISAAGGVDAPATPLAKVLVGNSASGVEWLQAKFGLDLSLVGRLGGHSFPRTHRGKEQFPGMTITYALMEKIMDLSTAHPEKARCILSAKVTKLITKDGAVVGVQYEQDGKTLEEYGVVVIATGGYAAGGLQENSLLHKYRPDLVDLPTTNGEHATGDGIELAEAVGGATLDLDQVQVHPTGLVHPEDPNNKVKFLAAEALRGAGGIILDANGRRFCDELGRRDYVTGEMKKNKGPFRLVLNSSGGREIEWHCKHYEGRGVMKHFKSGADLAKEIGVSNSRLEETFSKYSSAAKAQTDEYGKKFFTHCPFEMKDNFWVAFVTPVVHYCMGGVKINTDSAIIDKNDTPVPGLFAAGEICGGVHGKNRLGGSSLLGCVVFGRVAGDSASAYLMSQLTKQSVEGRLGVIGGHLDPHAVGATVEHAGVTTRFQVHPTTKRITVDITWDETKGPAPVVKQTGTAPSSSSASSPKPAAGKAAPASSAPAGGAPSGPLKEYTMEEVAKHKTEQDCWVVVNGQVLAVTPFLKNHPGGKQAILLYAGKDASAEFNMLHKPDVVQKFAPNTIIGTLKAGSKL